MYKDRQCHSVGIILYCFVGVNLGKYDSFLLSIAENFGRSILLVELWKFAAAKHKAISSANFMSRPESEMII